MHRNRRTLLASGVLMAWLVGPLTGQGGPVSSRMELVTALPRPACTTADCWAFGKYMLVARRFLGFEVVDLRDPLNPSANLIAPPGYPSPTPRQGVNDIKADDRYIYVSDQMTGAGVYIYDALPDPMNPTLVTSLGAATGNSQFAHNIWVDGDYLYAQHKIFDISDRANPTFVGRLTRSYVHDVVVLDGIAYVSNFFGGIELIDASDPSNPVVLGTKRYSGAATHNMWPSDDRNTLFTTDESISGGVGGHIRIWNIANPAIIFQVGSIRVGPLNAVVHNVHVHGDLLFVSYYTEGVRVFDIRDPLQPVEIAFYDTYLPAPLPVEPGPDPVCSSGSIAGCYGVYPWRPDMVLVSDLDSGLYVLRLTAITHDLSASSTTVPRTGATVNVDFAYRNTAPAALNGFGVLGLTKVNGLPLFVPIVVDTRLLPPQAAANWQYPLVFPPLPPGMSVELSGYSGITPLVIGKNDRLTITVR